MSLLLLQVPPEKIVMDKRGRVVSSGALSARSDGSAGSAGSGEKFDSPEQLARFVSLIPFLDDFQVIPLTRRHCPLVRGKLAFQPAA